MRIEPMFQAAPTASNQFWRWSRVARLPRGSFTVLSCVLLVHMASTNTVVMSPAYAQFQSDRGSTSGSEVESDATDEVPAAPPMQVPPGYVPLAQDNRDEIWIDKQTTHVLVGGQVVSREAPLEMFACPRQTKEYESVVAVNTKAGTVHAALLAVGAQVGHPVRYQPEYTPAEGLIIDVLVMWDDESGQRQQVRAQEWVRNARTGKPMDHDWVFAGSGFWTDEITGERFYHAEGGELICVSNFPTATLDLNVASPQANSELLFEAFTDRIPPLGTRVQLKLVPRHDDGRNRDAAATP